MSALNSLEIQQVSSVHKNVLNGEHLRVDLERRIRVNLHFKGKHANQTQTLDWCRNRDAFSTHRIDTKTIVYKTVKSIAFKGKAATLSAAQKKLLTAAAKVIAKSTYTSFVVSVTPKATDLPLSATRAAKVHAYLMAELKKLKSKKVVTISLTPKTSKTSTAVVVQQGK